MAPKRHHPHLKWKPNTPIPGPPPSRTKLTTEEVAELAKKMQHEFGWDSEPRDFQLEGTRAQLEGTDMIIQAPTGCGKTAVAAGPHVWPSSRGKITIVISPLLALEEEMVHTFTRDFKLSAIAVHNRNGGCSRATAQKLLSDSYQILLVSPEMIQSRTFINRVLRNPKFSRKVLSMVVDEAHCISHWGADFRKKYGTLGVVRTFLPRNTPVVAMTATLTARARRDIHTKLQFSKGHSRFINIGNDRPNVSIVVRALEHTQASYVDLDFVIPATVDALTDIPKTWVYVDNIATGNEIVDHLGALLQSRVKSTEREVYSDAIRPFNAVLSLSYRRAAMEAFREGKIRIMICTDAAGMGCDIPDVDIVVQWMMPKTFSNWIQRAGRAARGRGRTGLAVLLVPSSVYKKVIDTSMNVSSQTSGGGKPKGKARGSKKAKDPSNTITPEEYAILHGVNRGKRDKQDQKPTVKQPPFDEEAADEGLTVFVQSTRCRREVWAQAFDVQINRSALTVACCDICDPGLFDHTRPGDKPRQANAKTKGRNRGQPVPEVEKRLREWRRLVYRRDHEFAVYEAKSLLDEETVALLASHGDLTPQMFARLMSGSWIWWERHGNELYGFLKSLGPIPYIPMPSKSAASKTSTAETAARSNLSNHEQPASTQPKADESEDNSELDPESAPVRQAEAGIATAAKRTMEEFLPISAIRDTASGSKRPRTSQAGTNSQVHFQPIAFDTHPPAPTAPISNSPGDMNAAPREAQSFGQGLNESIRQHGQLSLPTSDFSVYTPPPARISSQRNTPAGLHAYEMRAQPQHAAYYGGGYPATPLAHSHTYSSPYSPYMPQYRIPAQHEGNHPYWPGTPTQAHSHWQPPAPGFAYSLRPAFAMPATQTLQHEHSPLAGSSAASEPQSRVGDSQTYLVYHGDSSGQSGQPQ